MLFPYISGRFGVTMTQFYAAEIVLVLECLHSHSIAYRDLKVRKDENCFYFFVKAQTHILFRFIAQEPLAGEGQTPAPHGLRLRQAFE